MSLQAGTTAPDFTLFHAKGESTTLSSLRGQKVVLAFYPAAFTGVCTQEMCTFRDSLSQFNDLNCQVLGVSVNYLFSNVEFASKNSLNFPLLADFKAEVTRAYGLALENFVGIEGYTVSHRAVFVIDAEGTIAYAWVGENPGVLPDFDAVQAAVEAA